LIFGRPIRSTHRSIPGLTSYENCVTMKSTPKMRTKRWFRITIVIVILHLSVFASSCSHLLQEETISLSDPQTIPQTDEPIVALVGRSLCGDPIPYFVLYGNGSLIYANPREQDPKYMTVVVTADQVRRIYSFTSDNSLDSFDAHTFTPGGSLMPTYFLLIRKKNGKYLRVATYSLPPYEKWSGPPEKVTRVLNFLSYYSVVGASKWTPQTIEVIFQQVPPSPHDKSWWPKKWPQPKETDSGKSGPIVLHMDGSYANQLKDNLRRYSFPRFPSGTYDIFIRYPFPHEKGLMSSMNEFSMGSFNLFLCHRM
jgi:hypothetical protein